MEAMTLREKARIVESAEAAYLAASFGNASPEVAEALGMKAFQMWGGVATIMANDPTGGFWSRCIGMGIDREISTDLLEALDSLYLMSDGKSICFQVSPIAQPVNYEDVLEANGYVRGRTWEKLLRELHDVPEVETYLEIKELGVEHAPEYGEVCCATFGMPGPHLVAWVNDHLGKPDWRAFGAFDGAKMVGVGAMYARGDVACLVSGATLPEYRGRGAQSAIMVARLNAAAEMELSWASTETGSETADSPNPSLHNMERLGFEVVYQRYNWIKSFEPK